VSIGGGGRHRLVREGELVTMLPVPPVSRRQAHEFT
jgi:hypothetical protein